VLKPTAMAIVSRFSQQRHRFLPPPIENVFLVYDWCFMFYGFLPIAVPPKIMPIQAMTNMLREGMRAAISCQILEGDLPVSFRWERNGKPLIGTG